MDVHFRFEPGQRVKIEALECTGVVEALCFDGYVNTYRVGYWLGGDRKMPWVRESELDVG